MRRFANGTWKVDAGADFGVTQLFYDCSLYFDYLKKVTSPLSFWNKETNEKMT